VLYYRNCLHLLHNLIIGNKHTHISIYIYIYISILNCIIQCNSRIVYSGYNKYPKTNNGNTSNVIIIIVIIDVMNLDSVPLRQNVRKGRGAATEKKQLKNTHSSQICRSHDTRRHTPMTAALL